MVFFVEKIKMARIEAITSKDLVYQVNLTGLIRGRDTAPVWTGIVPPRRPGGPPTVFTPRGVDKTRSGVIEHIDPFIGYTAATGRLNYGYGLICYDFRTNNEERLDTSGRPDQRMNNVKRIQSAELTFQVSAVSNEYVAANAAIFYIACLPKINLISSRRGPLPNPFELGMNYFLGYNEVYRNPVLGGLVGDERSGSGNINPACFAGRTLGAGERPPPFPIVQPIELTDRDSYPVTVTVKLKPRMLRALESAMRNGTVFGLAAVPVGGFGEGPQQFTAGSGYSFWDGSMRLPIDFAFGGRIRSGLNASYDPPKLVYRYTLDNNKINTGAGISRTSTSGFMEGNLFAGTNSGFSD